MQCTSNITIRSDKLVVNHRDGSDDPLRQHFPFPYDSYTKGTSPLCVQTLAVTNAEGMTTAQTNEQRITSLEIAKLTGKQHKNVMQAIRNMESAWERERGRNFALM